MDSSRSSMARRCHCEGSRQGKEREKMFPPHPTTSFHYLNSVQGGGGLMQQLKRSYSLTDLGEQQFDQHRFTDVTEEEDGAIFLLHPSSSISLLSSHVQSNSDMQPFRLRGLLWNFLQIITTTQCSPRNHINYPSSAGLLFIIQLCPIAANKSRCCSFQQS